MADNYNVSRIDDFYVDKAYVCGISNTRAKRFILPPMVLASHLVLGKFLTEYSYVGSGLGTALRSYSPNNTTHPTSVSEHNI